jgi:uncharacterized membrane protein YidH (DUF202 family)
MNRGRVLFHLVKADFLVRVRRSSFLWTLGFAIFLGYETFAGKILLNLDDYRGIYNSAWVGALMATVASLFLSLAGFYIVKGAVEQDQTSRVGQVLATTPMTRVFYTAAKTIGNFAVLAAMVLMMMAAAVLMQFFRAEDRSLDLWALLAPLLLYTLPAMAFVAALAVLFETLPVLHGGAGNVIWFFLWAALLAAGIGAVLSQDQAIGASLYFRDFCGLPSIMFQMRAALRQIDPHSGGQFALTIGGQAPARRFLWPGLHWNAVQLEARLGWIGLASAAVLLAALFFHRFDPAREPLIRVRRQAGELLPPESLPRTAEDAPEAIAWSGQLTPVLSSGSVRHFVRLVAAELRLMMKGQRWWWYAVAAGLFVACLAAPLEVSRGDILVAAWLWPILLWSRMGSREARCATESLVFSCPHTLSCQLPAAWLAGVMVALLTGGGVGIRLLLASDAQGLAAWTAGALFIPTLAMALGLASRNSKLFEALYTVWWYVGALHHTPSLDYMGTTPASSRPVSFFLLTGVLLLACHLARRFQSASIRLLRDRRLVFRG